MGKAKFDVRLKKIWAGKLRRYHNVSFIKQLFDIPTILKNVRDMFLVGVGFLQSLLFLARVKPDVVFTKGGFVCLPVGFAAKMLGIPLVIHDSDSHPGLTNKILARFASKIATGESTDNYPNYPKEITKHTGIPTSNQYRPTTPKQKQELKSKLGVIDTKKPLVLITGGGLGSRNLNSVVINASRDLLDETSILHIAGQANYREVSERAPDHPGYMVVPFLTDTMVDAVCAADIVITRAGATSLQELASAAKPIIVVPSPYLTGGHQLKNASIYAAANAAVVLSEDDIILKPLKLKKEIEELLHDVNARIRLAKAIYKFAKPHAALDVATLIVEAAAESKPKRTNK